MLILCASCKSYFDAWHPFDTLFGRMWPDCPYRKVLFSDRYWPDGMKSLDFFDIYWLEHDGGWIQNLLTILEMTSAEFQTVMLFQEDFFLCYPVDQPRIASILEWFEKSDYDCCRLYPCPGGNGPVEIFPGISEITSDAPYRVSCQTAIWKRDKLMELCRRLLAAGWKRIQRFEQHGGSMVDDFRLCGWIRRDGDHPSNWPVSYQCSAIAHGKWMSGAVKFCLSEGIVLNPKRPVLWMDSADDSILAGRYAEAVREAEARQQ